jgi:hypothetical protein
MPGRASVSTAVIDLHPQAQIVSGITRGHDRAWEHGDDG